MVLADPRRYVHKIIESYERMFGGRPKKLEPPLEAGDHPELDASGFCTEHQISQYQTLIGQLQLLISLQIFDIQVCQCQGSECSQERGTILESRGSLAT